METKITSFKELRIWQKGIEIVKDVYRITDTFPKKELYCLTTQMRRAAISIPSNIAEGFKRKHNKENKQYLYIALGSIAELETQLIISYELKYTMKNDFDSISEKIDHFSRMTNLLIKKL